MRLIITDILEALSEKLALPIININYVFVFIKDHAFAQY